MTRITRLNDYAGFGSFVYTVIETASEIIKQGRVPVVDFRPAEAMSLYRTHPNENVWDTFFHQKYSAIEAESSPQLLTRDGRHSSIPEVEWSRGQWVAKQVLTVKPSVQEAIDDLINKYIGKYQKYNCVYYRGTDKCAEVTPVPFKKYEPYLHCECPLVVQTDQQAFLEYALAKRPDAITLPELRTSNNEHPLHTDRTVPGFTKGCEALTVIQLLVRAQKAQVSQSCLTHVANLLRIPGMGLNYLN